MHLLIYIDIALFIFIAFFIGYDLFFTLASFFRRRHRKHRSIRLQKFAVIFAAYKEDLKKKIVKANEELAKVSFKYKTN